MALLKKRNYTPFIWIITILLVVVVLGLNYIPRSTDNMFLGIDLSILPLINAILNGIAFLLLIGALVSIKKGNIEVHRKFIYSAFIATFLFLLSYVTYHAVAGSTSFGGEGIIVYVYFFILITHIILATILLPLALVTLARGLNREDRKHRQIARWTMPIWLYVSVTGVIVYLLISPYY